MLGGRRGCKRNALTPLPFLAPTDQRTPTNIKAESRQLLFILKNLFTFYPRHALYQTTMRVTNPFKDTTLVDIHTISPEQQRALGVLNSNLPKWRSQLFEGQMELSQLTTNFMCFSPTPIKNLPHDNTWVWNQSNAKIHVQLNEHTFVSFQKMNTRKKKNAPKPPSHKLWMYAIHTVNSNMPSEMFFLWCEKGILKQPLAVNAMPCTSPRGVISASPSPNSFTVIDHKNSSMDNLSALFAQTPPLTPICSMEFADNTASNPVGCKPNSKDSPHSFPLSLESLSFLSPFVEPSVAAEFGWF